MSLNFLSTRFQCSWPWDMLVMLCDGRLVCGCADPYGQRVLGDARTSTIREVWAGETMRWPRMAGTVADGTLTATLANGPANATDWVALYCPPTAGSYADWKYLSDSTTPPASGVTGATLHFPVPTSATTCEVRWFANNTFTLLATSAPVATSSPTIDVPGHATAGGTLSVTLAGGPRSPYDWVALYCPAGAGSYTDYKYMNDSRTAPGTGVAGATVTLMVPLSATTCQVRWYGNNTFALLASSSTVAVP